MMNTNEMKARNKKLVKVMRRDNSMIINNHTGEKETITGLVEFKDATKGLSCMFNARYYSLNAALIYSDEIHC